MDPNRVRANPKDQDPIVRDSVVRGSIVQELRDLAHRWCFVLVRCGSDYILPVHEEAYGRLLAHGGYDTAFFAFLEEFVLVLKRSAWCVPGHYFPGGWWRFLQSQGKTDTAATIDKTRFAPFYSPELIVDASGDWFLGATRIQGRAWNYLQRHLNFEAASGHYRVAYPLGAYHETRYLHAQSPPYRVERLTWQADEVLLHLNDGTQEKLDLASLRLDANERLHVSIGTQDSSKEDARKQDVHQGLPARLSAKAHWEVFSRLEASDEGWDLSWGGQRHALALHAAWPAHWHLPCHGMPQ